MRIFCAILISLIIYGCSGGDSTPLQSEQTDAGPQINCGPNTILIDNVCWSKDEACDGEDDDGDGLTDEGCPQPQDQIICGEGTTLKDGKCVPLSNENSEICDGTDNNGNGTIDEGCAIGEAILCHSDENCVNAPWGPFCVFDIILEASFCQACLQDTQTQHHSVGGISPGCGGDLPVCAWGGTDVPVTDITPDGMVSFYWCGECGDQYPCPDGQLCIIGECVPTDENHDKDNDGFSPFEGDCNDNDYNINPLAVDYCDGIDNDCDNETDEEDPNVGLWCISFSTFTTDNWETSSTIPNPGITVCSITAEISHVSCVVNCGLEEVCNNGLDDNCDFQVDEGCGDDPVDWCNGIDDDGDGQIDEDDPNFGHPCVTNLYDPSQDSHYIVQGSYVCGENGIICNPPTLEDCQLSDEICNNIFDDNCDGQVDEGCGGCANDSDCDDDQPCTTDHCVDNTCLNLQFDYCQICSSDQDCVEHQVCDPLLDGYKAVVFTGICDLTGYCQRDILACEFCQNGSCTDDDPSCIENPVITIATDTPSGAFAPEPDTGLVNIAVTAGSEDANFHGLALNVMAIINTPDADDEMWVLEDFSGLALATVTADISGNASGVVAFNFNSPQIIPAGQTKYYYIYSDTIEMATSGDAIITWLTTSCGNELYGGQLINP